MRQPSFAWSCEGITARHCARSIRAANKCRNDVVAAGRSPRLHGVRRTTLRACHPWPSCPPVLRMRRCGWSKLYDASLSRSPQDRYTCVIRFQLQRQREQPVIRVSLDNPIEAVGMRESRASISRRATREPAQRRIRIVASGCFPGSSSRNVTVLLLRARTMPFGSRLARCNGTRRALRCFRL
jgi:hypothetical protein